ncbi:MAG: methyltransferase [Planctomycetes bacterium]|nr:methyltransferase [Planctomycetota bacterium]
MSAQAPFSLPTVAFFGRTLAEYLQCFCLDAKELRGLRVLDCPSGPGSFAAEATALGCDVVAVDPAYEASADELERRASADIDACIKQMRAKPWAAPLGDLDAYEAAKREALGRFIKDFRANPERYRAASLPKLPFADRQFDLVLSGHLLFFYAPLAEDGALEGHRFDLAWHHEAIGELARVCSGEMRVYPTMALNVAPRRHCYASPIEADLEARGWRCNFLPSIYAQYPPSWNNCLVARRLSVTATSG